MNLLLEIYFRVSALEAQVNKLINIINTDKLVSNILNNEIFVSLSKTLISERVRIVKENNLSRFCLNSQSFILSINISESDKKENKVFISEKYTLDFHIDSSDIKIIETSCDENTTKTVSIDDCDKKDITVVETVSIEKYDVEIPKDDRNEVTNSAGLDHIKDDGELLEYTDIKEYVSDREDSIKEDEEIKVECYEGIIEDSVEEDEECNDHDIKLITKVDEKTEKDGKLFDRNETINCDICKRKISENNISHHRKTHTGCKPYSCNQCNKSFIRRVDMKNHMLIHGPRDKVACGKCGKYVLNEKALLQHLDKGVCERAKKVTEKKLFKCNICNVSFRTEDNLNKHKETFIHDKYSCSYCNKKFFHKTYYERHILTHSSEKPFSCELCGLMFKSEKCVKVHKSNIHEENIPVSCKICNKVIKQKKYLRYHMMVHSDERAYNCEICGQTFRQPHGLQKHKLSHTNERPFSCDVCGKAYRDKQTFDKHKVIHNKDEYFRCEVCSRSFSFLSALNRHYQRVHKMDKK